MNNYIDRVQEDTLSSYPISIQAESVDMSSLMTTLMGINADDAANKHDKDAVYGNTIMYEMMNAMTSTEIQENNVTKLKTFLDEQMSTDSKLSRNATNIQYTYNLPMNLYTKDSDGKIVKSDVMSLMSKMRAGVIGDDAEQSVNQSMNDMFSSSGMSSTQSQFVVWQEMLPGDGDELISPVLQGQYDVLYGSWPQSYDEVVLIVDENNEVSDMVLYALGLKSSSEMLSAMTGYMSGQQTDTEKVESWSYADVCKKTFSLILPADFWQKDPQTGEYKDISSDELGLKTLYSNGIQLKIVGVVRQSADAVSGMMNGAIGYTNALTKYVVEQTAQKELVKQQLADPQHDIFTGLPFKASDKALSTDEIKKAVQDYCAGIDQAKKAELYIAYMSLAPDSYVSSMIEEKLGGVSREDIEKQVVESYPEYVEMLSAMDDETLMSYMREMLTEQVKKAYAEEVKKQMSQLDRFPCRGL